MPSARNTMMKLPRAVLPIYGTTLADMLGYTLMIPLLPVLVKQYHAPDVVAGALLSIPALCSAIAAPLWGKVSDHLGRKPIIIAAQVLSLTGYLVLALSHSLVLILVSRIISGCGGGSLGVAESYIADVTKPAQRELAYSLYGAVFGFAFVAGPATAGALMQKGVAIPFLVAAFLEAINIAFTFFFLPLQKKAGKKKTSIRASLRAASEPGVWRVLARQFLFIFSIVVFLTNFSLFVSAVLHVSIAHAAYLLAVAGAVGGISLLIVVTPLSRRIGDLWTSELGLAITIVGYAVLTFTKGTWMFLIATSIWAIGAAMVEPILTSLLSRRAKRTERGAIMGISDSINSIAMILGPATGAAIVAVNARLLGVFSAAALVGALLLGLRGSLDLLHKHGRASTAKH